MKAANVCLIGLVFVVSVSAEPLLEGRVRLESGESVADAQVRLFDMTDLRQGAIARALTDGTGYFALPLAALGGRALPERFALGPNYPNPFNPSTIIPYQLAASSAVRLEVFNLLGQRITTLVDGERPAGFHTATWHATDGAGRAVGAGVYIYRMTVGVERQTGRMVLLDGQAGVSAGGAASVMPGASGIGGLNGADAQVYGLIVSGSGLVPYVDSSFRVEAGMAPVELVVSSGLPSAGKATDDDCAFCDLFGTFNDQQEDETEEEEAETDSTSSEGGPDLIVQSPSVSTVMLMPGQEFTLNVTVHNQGDEQAAATTLHYYRSNNATITSSDTKVGTDAVGALDASATSEESIALTAPTSVSAEVGIYYGACVAGVRGESNTDNNCSSAVKITLSGQEAPEEETQEEEEETTEEEGDETPEEEEDDAPEEEEGETPEEDEETDSTSSEGGPDLIVQSPSVSVVMLTPGQEFTLHVTVHNQGDGQAAATTLHYYRSSNATITSSDTEVGTDAVGALDASATSAKSIALTAPTSVSAEVGIYYGACVASVRGESNTDNNCSPAVEITVSGQESPEEEATEEEEAEEATEEEEDDDTPVTIPDANLRSAIEAALGKARGAPITVAEMKTLGELNANDAGIRDLTGLEFATNLGWALWLYNNNITDISSLAGLTNLTRLALGGNNITDISALAGLTNLDLLDLGYNSISDFSALSGLTNLTTLHLSLNNITDISPLAGLTNLTTLNLRGNNITDLSPLVTNTGLGSGDEVDVRDNPLDAASKSTHIPELQARGVSVSFDEILVFTDPQIYNDNVFVLPVSENIAAGNLPLRDYSARFYEYFNDEFDFLMFVANLPQGGVEPGAFGGASYLSVKGDVQGIGLDSFFDNRWGFAGELKGVIYFATYATYPFSNYGVRWSIFTDGTPLHELIHRWAAFILDGIHWGFSSANGALGGFDIASLVDHGGGRYTAGNFDPDNRVFGVGPYSPIELYLAGFIPPEEVPDLWVAEDGEWLYDEEGRTILDDNEYPIFTASRIKTYTIEDIIAEHGPRVPDHSQAQKDFRAAVILLISEDYPAIRQTLERLSDDVSWLSHAGEDEAEQYNFYEATGGRGTITMDGLSQFKSRASAKRLVPSSFGTPPPPIVDIRE